MGQLTTATRLCINVAYVVNAYCKKTMYTKANGRKFYISVETKENIDPCNDI